MVFQESIKLAPHGKGSSDITDIISGIIKDSGITTGTCQLFVHSSRCSLLISDTADETTRRQTADFMAQLAPNSNDAIDIIDENMDAVPVNQRIATNRTSVSCPVSRNKPLLGTWQGIYLWEQSIKPQQRKLTITIIGE